MKQYPSIPNHTGSSFEELDICHIYDKLDGNNMRFEYNFKKGWHKFGTRTQLISMDDPVYGPAVVQFLTSDISKQLLVLTPKYVKGPIQEMTAFFEWHGPNSFAGRHVPGDKMRLSLLDLTYNRRGFLEQKSFLKAFLGEVDTPNYLGIYNWTRGFVSKVHEGEIPGVTFEGVVGKTQGKGSVLKMGKAKTKLWKEKIYSLYTINEAEKLVNS